MAEREQVEKFPVWRPPMMPRCSPVQPAYTELFPPSCSDPKLWPTSCAIVFTVWSSSSRCTFVQTCKRCLTRFQYSEVSSSSFLSLKALSNKLFLHKIGIISARIGHILLTILLPL